MLLAYSSGVAPPLAVAALLQSNGSVHHPVATGATAVTAAQFVHLYLHVFSHTGCKVGTDAWRVVCLVCVSFSMEALSLIQRVSMWTSKASSEIVYGNELIKDLLRLL